MKLSCPACGCIASVEAFLHDKAGRIALQAALKMPDSLGHPLIEYLALFRPKERGLTWTRMSKLLAELSDQIQQCRVPSGRESLVAPLEYWRDGLNEVINKRDKGTLQLPLKNHKYLYTIVASIAARGVAAGEVQADASKRHSVRREDSFTPAAREVAQGALNQIASQLGYLRKGKADDDAQQSTAEA